MSSFLWWFSLIWLCGRNQLAAFIAHPQNRHGGLMLHGSPVIAVDSLLTRVLLEDDSASSDAIDHSAAGFGGFIEASNGIRAWRKALTAGRLPTETDFRSPTTSNRRITAISVTLWPSEPLWSSLTTAMLDLQLPRLALRHPEAVAPILLSLIRLAKQFARDLRELEISVEEDRAEEVEEEDRHLLEHWYLEASEPSVFEDDAFDFVEAETLVQDAIEQFTQQWGGVASAAASLDQLFGNDHGIIQFHDATTSGANDDDDNASGFGLQDGIWQHTGWKRIPELQSILSNMPEIKQLIGELGRRPTAENAGDQLDRFHPRKRMDDGAMGAELDTLSRESVRDIHFSNSLTEMLPSEAVLLKSSSSRLRQLFLAKKQESKLLSYQLSGWYDQPSIPKTKSRYKNYFPSAPGGPIVVCLDTSWSMSGMREQLSKAVALACVSCAHKQGRDCQLIAFSNKNGVVQSDLVTIKEPKSVERLLEFLSYSFGGGTDVTGALKCAMDSMMIGAGADSLVDADILLISDGEIPDPPLSKDMMNALESMQSLKGVHVHGLLVGKRESKPLSKLCTTTHDFLCRYDGLGAFSPMRRTPTATALGFTRASVPTRCNPRRSFCLSIRNEIGRNRLILHARRRFDDYDEDESRFTRTKTRRKKRSSTRENDDRRNDYDIDGAQGTNSYLQEVSQSVAAARKLAESTVQTEAETSTIEPLASFHSTLSTAIENLSKGLVERTQEVQLVLLALVAQEHILLLGVPGTGKSVIGRRLSTLCDGPFFQRLLTRFTTPEELFGPLSLRSLEQDEYRRVTQGFLPKASVAFLDEIFKANSAILNTLLTILNERKFDNGACGQEECPLQCVIGASNELPESDELVALYDRFLIRKEVLPVSDEGIINLLGQASHKSETHPTATENGVLGSENAGIKEVIDLIQLAADNVELGLDTTTLLSELRKYLRDEYDITISDRRLVKSARLLQVSAASHGRKKVDTIDCMILQHCLWESPEQKLIIKEWLWDNITPAGGYDGGIQQFRALLDGLRRDVADILRRTGGYVVGKDADEARMELLRSETTNLKAIVEEKIIALNRHKHVLADAREFLWMGMDEAYAAQQLLLPRAETVLSDLDDLILDIRSFEVAIAPDRAHIVPDELWLDVIENLWEEGVEATVSFSDDEMKLDMKEAKKRYDLETFRKWKRARKKLDRRK